MSIAATRRSDVVRSSSGETTLEHLIAELQQRRRAGQQVVTALCGFDLIHPDHVAFLNEARSLGGVLVVLLPSDKYAEQRHDFKPPILNEEERAAILLALRAVDFVMLLDDSTHEALAAIRPDVHCTAVDDQSNQSAETRSFEGFEVTTKVLPQEVNSSSLEIVERVLSRSASTSDQPSDFTSKSARDVYRWMLSGSKVLSQTGWNLKTRLIEAADIMADALLNKHKILVCGNGGSAADAQHFAAELVGRYREERQGWPVIALTVDTSTLTSVGNDYGFDQIFSRQVEALGSEGDVLLAISTSGKSANILNAVEAANRMGLRTMGLSGAADSPLAQTVQFSIQVASVETPLIQQAHIAVLHIICELLEGRSQSTQ